RTQQINGDGARCLLALRDVDIRAQLSRPRFAVLFGNVARQEEQIVGAHEWHEGGHGRGDGGESDFQLIKLFVDRHALSILSHHGSTADYADKNANLGGRGEQRDVRCFSMARWPDDSMTRFLFVFVSPW